MLSELADILADVPGSAMDTCLSAGGLAPGIKLK